MKPIHNHPCAMPPDKDWRNCIIPEDKWDGDTLIPQQLERYRRLGHSEPGDVTFQWTQSQSTQTNNHSSNTIEHGN